MTNRHGKPTTTDGLPNDSLDTIQNVTHIEILKIGQEIEKKIEIANETFLNTEIEKYKIELSKKEDMEREKKFQENVKNLKSKYRNEIKFETEKINTEKENFMQTYKKLIEKRMEQFLLDISIEYEKMQKLLIEKQKASMNERNKLIENEISKNLTITKQINKLKLEHEEEINNITRKTSSHVVSVKVEDELIHVPVDNHVEVVLRKELSVRNETVRQLEFKIEQIHTINNNLKSELALQIDKFQQLKYNFAKFIDEASFLNEPRRSNTPSDYLIPQTFL